MNSLKEDLAKQAQRTANHIKRSKTPVLADFPRGIIRTFSELQERWPYLEENRQKVVASTIQLTDINEFYLSAFHVGLYAGEMYRWHCTLPLIAAIETIMYEYGVKSKIISESDKFKTIIDKMNSKGVIKQAHRDHLQELREYRNEIHLFLKEKVELAGEDNPWYEKARELLKETEEKILVHWRGSH